MPVGWLGQLPSENVGAAALTRQADVDKSAISAMPRRRRWGIGFLAIDVVTSFVGRFVSNPPAKATCPSHPVTRPACGTGKMYGRGIISKQAGINRGPGGSYLPE